MKKALAVLAAVSIALSTGAIAFARADTRPTCPINKEKIDKIDPKLETVYKGKTFYFCCGSCKPTFDKMSDKDRVALMKYGVDIKKPVASKDAVKKAAPATAPAADANKPA